MKDTLQRYYDRVRPYLPRRRGTYRGYVARDDRLLDATTARPEYKEGVVRAIEANAPGRDVRIVGFGRGITAMVALQAGARSVTAYEAAEAMVDIGIESFRLNDVPTEDLTVRHAIVGEAIDVFGSANGADGIPPDEFDPGELLVLDCEGAEVSIIDGLSVLPERMIVETHPANGADTETVRQLMQEKGLVVESRPYEPGSDSKSVLVGRPAVVVDHPPAAGHDRRASRQ